MDTIIHYLKDGSLYQKIVVKLTELRVKLAGIGYHLNINCTEDHTMVPTLGVYTQGKFRAFFLNCMKAIMATIQGVDLSLIGKKIRAIDGPICRRIPLLTARNEISSKSILNLWNITNLRNYYH